MKSGIKRHSVVINGRKTNIMLEDAFWESLKDIVQEERTTLRALLTSIHKKRTTSNMSSAVRLYVFEYYRSQASDEPTEHEAAAHEHRLQSGNGMAH